jgi:GNAT superfamily N-acetyltransferase
MNTFQLIQVTHDHIEILRQLSIVTFTATYAQYNTPEDMQQYIATEFSVEKLGADVTGGDSAFYLALDRQTPIGYIKVNYAPSQTDLHDPESLELERIYVLKDYQGKKAGQFLLDAALAIALKNDLNYLWLGVWDKNTNAQQFYAKNGFVPFGTHTFLLGSDEQLDILLKKPVR